jgi:hypothetical protein
MAQQKLAVLRIFLMFFLCAMEISANSIHEAIEGRNKIAFIEALYRADESAINNQDYALSRTPLQLAIARGQDQMAVILATHIHTNQSLKDEYEKTAFKLTEDSVFFSERTRQILAEALRSQVFSGIISNSIIEDVIEKKEINKLEELAQAIEENRLQTVKELSENLLLQELYQEVIYNNKKENALERALKLRHFSIVQYLLQKYPEAYTESNIAASKNRDIVDNAHLNAVLANLSDAAKIENQKSNNFLRQDSPAVRGLSQFFMESAAFKPVRKLLKTVALGSSFCNINDIKKKKLEKCQNATIFALKSIDNLMNSLPKDSLSPNNRFFQSLNFAISDHILDEKSQKNIMLSVFILRFINPLLIKVEKSIRQDNLGPLVNCLQRLVNNNDSTATDWEPLGKFFQGQSKAGKKAKKLLDKLYKTLLMQSN